MAGAMAKMREIISLKDLGIAFKFKRAKVVSFWRSLVRTAAQGPTA